VDDGALQKFVNVNDNLKCQSCEDIFPGCKNCEQKTAEELIGDEYYIDLGTKIGLTSKPGQYLVCLEPTNPGSI
jgi:hypothetical protein